jgi:hypothetical protein
MVGLEENEKLPGLCSRSTGVGLRDTWPFLEGERYDDEIDCRLHPEREEAMSAQLKTACDDILQRVTTVKDRVPGVVAMVTDRSANIYEGAAGERIVGSGKAMMLECNLGTITTSNLGRAKDRRAFRVA